MYKWAKGGSYAGEWKRGTFNGLGLRFLKRQVQVGAVRGGRVRRGHGHGEERRGREQGGGRSEGGEKAAEKSGASRDGLKPRRGCRQDAHLPADGGSDSGRRRHLRRRGGDRPGVYALPEAIVSLIAPLAAANGPLVLVTLGVLFLRCSPSFRRVVANFLATKYSLSLVAAAAATAFVPPRSARFGSSSPRSFSCPCPRCACNTPRSTTRTRFWPGASKTTRKSRV